MHENEEILDERGEGACPWRSPLDPPLPTLDGGRGGTLDGGGKVAYLLSARERGGTLDGGGGRWLTYFQQGRGVRTLDGEGVPTLDGEGYLPWMKEGYLPWRRVPTLGRGYLPWMGEGYPPWTLGTYLRWGGVPTFGQGVPTLDGGGKGIPTLDGGRGEEVPTLDSGGLSTLDRLCRGWYVSCSFPQEDFLDYI